MNISVASEATGGKTPMNLKGLEERASELINKACANVSSALLGKPEAVRLALVALLADGHLLVEDVPGIGKTLLAKALAKTISCTFNRIQFTPDLLPSDLLGTSVYQQNTGAFVFQQGPLFAQIVLADEINRATPRTQSALLEAMSDRQISVDGQTRKLGPPFFVLATQNPREFEGTYPLPESQLDRFLIRLPLGYPNRESERLILLGHREGEPVEKLKPVLSADEINGLQLVVCKMPVEETLSEYILDIVEATRNHRDVLLGASTRAALGLYRAAQAEALVRGRKFVVPDDVKHLVRSVLAHRILPRSAGGTTAIRVAEQILDDILTKVPVPE